VVKPGGQANHLNVLPQSGQDPIQPLRCRSLRGIDHGEHMRAILLSFAALGALALSSAANAASAQFGLSMPFACRSDAGVLTLAPAPLRTYPILGTPEHRQFSACSPRNPEFCRNWNLHRFDIDCGGIRVSWLSVVDVLAKGWMPNNNRFWVGEGQLHVRTGPLWGGNYGRPCYFEPTPGYGPWRNRGPGFHAPCERPWMGGQPETIALPPGFAPMLASFAHFEVLPQTRPEAVRPQTATQTFERPSAPTATGSLGLSRQPDTKNNAQAETGTGANSKGSSSRSEPAKAEDKGFAAKVGISTVAASRGPSQPVAASKLWFGLIATFLILSISLLYRREARSDTRAIAEPKKATYAFRGGAGPQPPLRPHAAGTSSASIEYELSDFDQLPKTRAEALRVLGASQETREEVLKEMVRALRRKWHPDRARKEDRAFREHRLKQINVAWDILRTKKSASAIA